VSILQSQAWATACHVKLLANWTMKADSRQIQNQTGSTFFASEIANTPAAKACFCVQFYSTEVDPNKTIPRFTVKERAGSACGLGRALLTRSRYKRVRGLTNHNGAAG